MKSITIFLLSLFPFFTHAAEPSTLMPLMAIPGKVALRDDFSKDGPVDRTDWLARQGLLGVLQMGCCVEFLHPRNIRQSDRITRDLNREPAFRRRPLNSLPLSRSGFWKGSRMESFPLLSLDTMSAG